LDINQAVISVRPWGH